MPTPSHKYDPRVLVVVLVLLIVSILIFTSLRPTGHAIGTAVNARPPTLTSIPGNPMVNASEGQDWFYDCDSPGMINLCPLVCLDFARDEEAIVQWMKPCAAPVETTTSANE